MNLSIQDWGSIGEVIAAIAAIATLIYLAYQIRQSSKALSRSETNIVLSKWSSFRKLLFENDDLMRSIQKEIWDLSALSEQETAKFDLIASELLHIFRHTYDRSDLNIVAFDEWVTPNVSMYPAYLPGTSFSRADKVTDYNPLPTLVLGG